MEQHWKQIEPPSWPSQRVPLYNFNFTLVSAETALTFVVVGKSRETLYLWYVLSGHNDRMIVT